MTKTLLTTLTVAGWLLATPVAAPAQDYDPWTDTWEWPSYVEPPPAYESDNPALDRQMDELYRQQWLGTMQALEQRAWAEKFRIDELNACAGITMNPAAAEECRRRAGY